jgi:hypothetical protein
MFRNAVHSVRARFFHVNDDDDSRRQVTAYISTRNINRMKTFQKAVSTRFAPLSACPVINRPKFEV